MRSELLAEADALVHGDRQESYGHPAVNHARTASLWRAYLKGKYGPLVPLDAEDVCFLNVLQKIAREMHSPSHDGIRDVAGYAANVEAIRQLAESPESRSFG